eukprot:2295546-Pyramimonas_sp.AAC.1
MATKRSRLAPEEPPARGGKPTNQKGPPPVGAVTKSSRGSTESRPAELPKSPAKSDRSTRA